MEVWAEVEVVEAVVEGLDILTAIMAPMALMVLPATGLLLLEIPGTREALEEVVVVVGEEEEDGHQHNGATGRTLFPVFVSERTLTIQIVNQLLFANEHQITWANYLHISLIGESLQQKLDELTDCYPYLIRRLYLPALAPAFCFSLASRHVIYLWLRGYPTLYFSTYLQ